MLGGSGCSGPDDPDADTASAPQAPQRVIWIVIDSLRADHLGMHGYARETSPWMDELAGRSVTFDWAISPSNETLVSVAAYFTGRPVSSMLSPNALVQIPESVETLAQQLEANGVRARALSANPYMRPEFGYTRGFSEFTTLKSPGKVLANIDEIIDEVARNYKPANGPEFIYIHTMDVHHPYRPPQPHAAMFTDGYAGNHVREGSLVENDRTTLARSSHPYWSESHDVQPADVEFLVGLYDGAIRYTDARLPDLLAALEWDPRRDVLILTADHGEHFFEYGWWTHFATLTPMEVRVPLIVHFAGYEPRRIEQPVGLIELFSTVLDVFGIERPADSTAASLFTVLTGEPVPNREVYAETQPRHGLSAALINSAHWYWLSGNRSTLAPWHAWPYEQYLFNYKADPGATENLIDSQPDVASAMNARLRELYPRWAGFESTRIAGDDDHVKFGPNLFTEEMIEAAAPPGISHQEDLSWRADVSPPAVRFRVASLTPYEPLYLRVPYELDTGEINLRFSPAEYLLPSRSGVRDAWEFDCRKPTAGQQMVAATILPTAAEGMLEVTFAAGTRAVVGIPTLQRMLFDWIEPWPRFSDSGADPYAGLTPEEIERLQTMGYLGK